MIVEIIETWHKVKDVFNVRAMETFKVEVVIQNLSVLYRYSLIT